LQQLTSCMSLLHRCTVVLCSSLACLPKILYNVLLILKLNLLAQNQALRCDKVLFALFIVSSRDFPCRKTLILGVLHKLYHPIQIKYRPLRHIVSWSLSSHETNSVLHLEHHTCTICTTSNEDCATQLLTICLKSVLHSSERLSAND